MGFALAVVFVLTVLFLPLPAWMIDLGLAFSIALSVLILMVALWIQRPLDFSAFPTVLLLATLLRLALNIATTRLILSNGAEGHDAAGHVIAGFASFVMGDNFVIGTIVFVILITVNFLVITKGATRIAEVGGALHPRCHPRQADGDRRRPQRRPDRRQGGDPTASRARGGKRLLRLHGRRLQVRARRRHCRPHHHGGQRVRRHHHRHDAARHDAGGRGGRVHQAVGRRRSRHPDSGPDRFAGRRPSRCRRAAPAGRPRRRFWPSSEAIRAPCRWPAPSCSCWRWRPGCRLFHSLSWAGSYRSSPTSCRGGKRRRKPSRTRGRARRPMSPPTRRANRSSELLKTVEIELCLGKQISSSFIKSAQRAGPARRQDAPHVRPPVRLHRARDQADGRSRHSAQALSDQDPRHRRGRARSCASATC